MIRKRYREEIAKALPSWSGEQPQWGKDDCALVFANMDIAIQGVDPAKPYRGRYRSERGAKRVLGKGGLLAAWGKAARRLGWRRLEKKIIQGAVVIVGARDGDRAVAITPAGVSTVIRYHGCWVGRCDHGDMRVSDSKIIRAWSVC